MLNSAAVAAVARRSVSHPADVAVEMALLGALLVNNSSYDRVADILDAHCFADLAHQRIYEAIQRLDRGWTAGDSDNAPPPVRKRGIT